jgi:Na+-driven multidrug efflux pump
LNIGLPAGGEFAIIFASLAVIYYALGHFGPAAQAGFGIVCSSMFQGLGNTKPVLLSSGARLITHVLPLIWLSATPDFRIEHVWYLSIATTTAASRVELVVAAPGIQEAADAAAAMNAKRRRHNVWIPDCETLAPQIQRGPPACGIAATRI